MLKLSSFERVRSPTPKGFRHEREDHAMRRLPNLGKQLYPCTSKTASDATQDGRACWRWLKVEMEHREEQAGCASEGSLPIKDIRITKLLFGQCGSCWPAVACFWSVSACPAAYSPRSCFLAATIRPVVVSVANRAAILTPGASCLLGPPASPCVQIWSEARQP